MDTRQRPRAPHLEAALVEGVGGELRQARVHPVLHLQPDGLHAKQHQPLEQGLPQPRAGSLRARWSMLRLLTPDWRLKE